MDGPRRSGDLCGQQACAARGAGAGGGKNCNLDLVIDDIRAELAGRPYELVSVAGGWQDRTKKLFGDAIHAAFGTPAGQGTKELSQSEALVLMCIAYFQPITRGCLPSSARRCRAI
jgi:chromosome segregation and condensation protein ScpB